MNKVHIFQALCIFAIGSLVFSLIYFSGSPEENQNDISINFFTHKITFTGEKGNLSSFRQPVVIEIINTSISNVSQINITADVFYDNITYTYGNDLIYNEAWTDNLSLYVADTYIGNFTNRTLRLNETNCDFFPIEETGGFTAIFKLKLPFTTEEHGYFSINGTYVAKYEFP